MKIISMPQRGYCRVMRSCVGMNRCSHEQGSRGSLSEGVVMREKALSINHILLCIKADNLNQNENYSKLYVY